VVALGLLGLFACTLVGSLFPLQVTDPSWQLRMATLLISIGPLAVLALALLHLAADLDPRNGALEKRLRTFSQLAVLATLGFALLLPLIGHASLRLQNNFYEQQVNEVKAKERKIGALRLALASNNTVSDLNLQFQRLQGPVLEPKDLALPLPELKRRLESVFREADQMIARQRQALPQRLPLRQLPDLLSKGLSSLVLALMLSALARRPGCEISLFQEWLEVLNRLQLRKASRRTRVSQEKYIRQLSGEE
jgi:hypothetical protein